MIQIGAARASDLDAVLGLLARGGLPLDGVAEHLTTMVIAREDTRIVGAAAIEPYADGGLLRSVVVDPAVQGEGVGRLLVEAAVAYARARSLPALYLLTTTAADYFPRFGFAAIPREDVPPGVRQSVEFRSACPASAVVMARSLAPET
jgi:amino-acid N-acetyltransferase